MVRPGNLLYIKRAVGVLGGIGLKKTTLGRIIVGDKSQATPFHVRVVVNKTDHGGKYRIRMRHALLYIVKILTHGRFCKLQGVTDFI